MVDVGSLKSSAYSDEEEEVDGEEDDNFAEQKHSNRESNSDDSFLSSTITMQAKVAPKEVKYSMTDIERKIRESWDAGLMASYSVSSYNPSLGANIMWTSGVDNYPGFITTRRGDAQPQIIDSSQLSGNTTRVVEQEPRWIDNGAPFGTTAQHYVPPVPMTSEDEVRSMVITANIVKLGELILKNGGNIKIDLFPMQTELPTNKIKIIGGNVFVAPYVILKAKQKYCRDPKTSTEMYLKHLYDLERSFEAVRIKGINYPEDIMLLKSLRTGVLAFE